MSFRTIFFFFSIICCTLISAESFSSGIWFSEKKEFRNGYEFLQLTIQDNKFIFAKLSYNEERKWEETKVLGLIENKKDILELKPEMCTVFSAKKLGERWILIRGFDCDHLQLKLTKNEQEIIISPSIGITESVTLKSVKQHSKNAIGAIVVAEDKKTFQVWSLGMRYVKKGASVLINGKPVIMLETVDSTGSFSSNEFIRKGEIISIHNPKSSGLFD
jgi:hypothetical protein